MDTGLCRILIYIIYSALRFALATTADRADPAVGLSAFYDSFYMNAERLRLTVVES